MKIGQRAFTAGDKRRYQVSYDTFLDVGVTIADATVTTPDVSVTISGIDFATDPRLLVFFLAGGTAGTPFTVTVTMTDSSAQVVTDTIDFARVLNPDGT